MKVLLTGGGTGGHLYPLLAGVRKIRTLIGEDKAEFLYVGPVNKFSKQILENNGIKTKGILTAKWRRYWSFKNFIDIFKFPLGLIQSLFHILIFMPDVVFSKGGYGSVAPTIAARLYWVPILVHESDAVPGKANQMMAMIADKVAVSFDATKQYFKDGKLLLTGNPVRENIQEGRAEKAQQFFKLNSTKPLILIMGGSQGSQLLNQRILEILPWLLNSYQVIHQVGAGNMDQVKRVTAEQGIKVERSDYHAVEFLGEELVDAYMVADLVISRAGAGSISEIAAVKKPAILVPLALSANKHQLFNAYMVGKKGGAVIIEEPNLKGELLLSQIDNIMNDPSLRARMSEAIGYFYEPEAAGKIAKGLMYLAKLGNVTGKGLFDSIIKVKPS